MRVFLSSTCYDLPDARAVIERFLSERGDTPLLSDRATFPIRPSEHRHETCIREAANADVLILVIDRRRGAPFYRDGNITVTQAEFRAALGADVPIVAFVRQAVFDERATWSQNPGLHPVHTDDEAIFRFVSEVQGATPGIWMYPFADVTAIVELLRRWKPPIISKVDDVDLAEKTYLNFRDVPCQLLDSPVVVAHLERRYSCSAMTVGSTRLPVSVTWKNADAHISPDSILGDFDHSAPEEVTHSAVLGRGEYARARKYIKGRYEAPPSKVNYEGTDYCALSIDLSTPVPRISGAFGRYYDNILTQYAIEWELKKALLNGCADRLDERGVLPLREAVERGRNPRIDGSGRCAALSVSTLLVFRRRSAGTSDLYTLVRKRSSSVGVSPGLHHVVPAGMFESPNTGDRWSITENVWRELLEEVYNDHEEVGTGTSELKDYLYEKEPVRLLCRLIAEGRAELAVTGIIWDLLNLRSEICTVLYVPEPAFAEHRRMILNWEYEPEGPEGTFAIRWDGATEFVARLAAEGRMAVGGAACFALGRDWLRLCHKV
jgi:hypothetical protein